MDLTSYNKCYLELSYDRQKACWWYLKLNSARKLQLKACISIWLCSYTCHYQPAACRLFCTHICFFGNDLPFCIGQNFVVMNASILLFISKWMRKIDTIHWWLFWGSCSLWMVWFSTKTWWINNIYNKKVCFLVMLFYWLRENYPFLTLYDSLVVARLFANDLGIYSIGQQHPCYACSMQALLFSHVSTSTDHFWLIVGFYPPCYHYEQSLNKAATPHTRSRQRDPPQSQPQAESAWRSLQRQRMVLRIIHRQVKLSHADLPAPGAIGRPVWCKPGWLTL